MLKSFVETFPAYKQMLIFEEQLCMSNMDFCIWNWPGPKYSVTVLALIQMFIDDIHDGLLLLISPFLHSLHLCCFWLRGSFDHNFTKIKYVKFVFFVRLFSSTWDTSHLAVWAAS